MNKYTFEELDALRFEEIVNDLLKNVYKSSRIESFKEGRDEGIDGRFEYENGKVAIIQSKHYLKSGYGKLLSTLKNTELDKVKKLNKENRLDKYIFATSVTLNPGQKKKILEVFGGFIENESDIFGGIELSKILVDNKEIEKKYFELWIKTTNVLEITLNNIINNVY